MPCASEACSWPGGAAGEEPSTLGPGEQLWLDAWIPRDDPLWVADVSAAAEWVGAWWMEALRSGGRHEPGFDVHTGRSIPGDLGDLVCFAGRGPGEVFRGASKVVGLSQWRAGRGRCSRPARTCAGIPCRCWRSWRWTSEPRDELARDLAPMAVGLAELDPPAADLDRVRAALLDSFSAFGMTPPGMTPPGMPPGGRGRQSSLPPLLSSFLFFCDPGSAGTVRPWLSVAVAVGGVPARPPAVVRRSWRPCLPKGASARPRRGGTSGGGGCFWVAGGHSGCGVEEKGVKWRAVV